MTATDDTRRNKIDIIISENVDLLRRRFGEDQQDLAEHLGLSPSGLSKKMSGRRDWTATEIDLIARRYDVSHDSLFREVRFEKPRPRD